MKAGSYKYKSVDEYIGYYPENIKAILEKLRKAIKQAAPKAEEVISYNMPAFKQNGMLIFYAVNKKHIGLYPTASGITVFKEELADYETSKGAIRFPIDKALPLTLIKNIVKYKVQENAEKAKVKADLKNVNK